MRAARPIKPGTPSPVPPPGEPGEPRGEPRGERPGRLRILAFCDYFTEGSSGGAERVTREVYRRLPDLGAEVMVLTATPFGEPGPSEVDGIPVLSVGSIDLSRLSGAQVSLAPRLPAGALRLVARFRPHVLHANGLHFQTTVAAAACQRIRGIPLVTTAHIGSPDRLPARMRAATAAYEATVGRYVLSRSARVIAVAQSVAEHVRHLGVPEDRIEVIANGVDLERFARCDRREAGLGTLPLLVFVGRLIENKGPGLLVEALGHLRSEGLPFRAAFVGDGPLRGDLERRLAAAGLSEQVTLAGHSTDVAGWLGRASVLVRPSLTEGMPLTVLEALASGVLVIASDIPGNTGLIRHLHNGLVFPAGDARALAATLRLALENPALASALAGAGHNSVRSFSWDACAEATLGVLAQAAAPAPRGTVV